VLLAGGIAGATPVEIWFQDEARIGQQGTLTRIWARRGTRPRAPRDQRYKWAYLFGAVCPERGTGAALVLPYANAYAMTLHLEEIGRCVTPGAHAIVLLDGAGYHIAKDLVVPTNISLLPIPPYSPELNPQENIWQYLRQNKLSNIVSKDYDTIVQNSCDAWIWLMNLPDQVRSIASRDWAKQVSC
jgi:putative transposase